MLILCMSFNHKETNEHKQMVFGSQMKWPLSSFIFLHIVSSSFATSNRCPLSAINRQLDCKPEMYDGVIHIFVASEISAQLGVAEFSTCFVQNCVITKNPEMITQSKAAVFDPHSPQISNRPRDQLWILMLLENPPNTINISTWNNLINYTASYQLKSDIPAPYGLIKKRRLITNLGSLVEAKTEGVLWIVSNCFTTNRREMIVRHLQRHIRINMFGRCANGRISRKQKLELMTSHRFYLAFENNNCDEYVTEKFFEALRFGIVPVVYGARKEYYEQIAPSHSFIHLEDFERVEHLAAYLHYLTNNQTAYNEYFHWKHKYYVSETKFFCRLCKLLQDPPANTYGDIEELWHQRSSCSSIPV